MDTFLQDARFALRTLLKTPGFAAVAVLTLAVGIGANTAIFSVLNSLLFRRAPYPDADRLVVVWDNNQRQSRDYAEVAPFHARVLQQRSRTLREVATYDYAGFTLTGAAEPEQVQGLIVSQNLFPMLGARAELGRTFLPGEDTPGRDNVVILSHAFWTRRFGADRSVIGRTVQMDGTPVTVVGVMPADFQFVMRADVWGTLAMPDSAWDNRRQHWLRVLGKLRPGASLQDARAEVATISMALEREYPETNTGWRMSAAGLNEGLFQGPIKPMLFTLLGAVGFVLLIACADVANLLLARGSARRREIAIRAAIGAGRGRLIRQMLTESAVLSLAGGALGVLLAVWGLDAILAAVPVTVLDFTPQMAGLRVDGTVLLYTLALSLVTALVFGVVPALRTTRPNLHGSLKDGDRGGADASGNRLRSTLVVAEVALALVLVTGAGLMVKSFARQIVANPGFRQERLLTFWFSLPQARYPDAASVRAFDDALVDRLRTTPGVSSVGMVNVLPLSGEGSGASFTVQGRPTPEERDLPMTNTRIISPDYFATIGIPLERGRGFGPEDAPDAPSVMVVSRTFAAQVFPGEDAIGQRIRLRGDSARTIVGVVGDVADWKLGNRSRAFVYVPYRQRPTSRMGVVLRTTAAPQAAVVPVRDAVLAVDKDQPIYGVKSMNELMDEALFGQRLSAGMMGVLALVALALAVVGIYGVVAYGVTQRTHEIGIRMALGAKTGDILRLVLRQGMRPVVIGLAIGIAGAVGVSRLLTHALFDMNATDPATFAATPALLAAAALAAIYVPARRATRVEPMRALRIE